MDEKRNFFEYVRDIILFHVENIKENNNARHTLLEPCNRADLLACYRNIVFSVIVLAAMLAACVFVMYHAVNWAVYALNFLNHPSNRALKVLAQGLGTIAILALIINSFDKKRRGKTEREQDAEKRTLAKDLLNGIQGLSRMYGLQRPDSTSDISSFALEPCEIKGNVYVYQFTVEKDVTSDKPFDESRFRKSLIRRLKRMERDNALTTATPYGFVCGDDEICSVLVISVLDQGDFIEIHVARADEDSYSLYKSENPNDNNGKNGPKDPDF
jgi:hypothetical protein